jgi:hypothetical protein
MSEILLNIHIEPLEEGGYLATSADLNGLIAQGAHGRRDTGDCARCSTAAD